MIRITEALPNPQGPDSGNEWIKIKNDGAETNLFHWRISDFSGKGKNFNNLNLKTGEERVFFTNTLGISLNNSGDRLCLSAKSQEESCVEYLIPPKEGEKIYFASNLFLASGGLPTNQVGFPFSYMCAAATVFGVVAALFLMRLKILEAEE